MADVSRRVLVGTAALFAGWYVIELMRTPEAPPPVDPDKQPPIELAIPKLTQDIPALTEFKETLDRPLFSSSRRPEEPEIDDGEVEALEEMPKVAAPVRLSAVIIEDEEKSALLEETRSRTAKRVKEGEAFEGWTLVEVREDGVVLESGGTRSEVELRNFDAPVTPPPVRPRRPTRRPGTTPQTPRAAQQPASRQEPEETQAPYPPPIPPRRTVPQRRSVPLPSREADG